MNDAGPYNAIQRVMLRLPVLLALVALFAVPPGVMPSIAPDGQLQMVICSGAGPVAMVFDPVTGEMKPADPGPGRTGCDWGMALAVTDLPAPIALPQPAFASRRATPQHAAALWRPAHDPRGIWARGPPLYG